MGKRGVKVTRWKRTSDDTPKIDFTTRDRLRQVMMYCTDGSQFWLVMLVVVFTSMLVDATDIPLFWVADCHA